MALGGLVVMCSADRQQRASGRHGAQAAADRRTSSGPCWSVIYGDLNQHAPNDQGSFAMERRTEAGGVNVSRRRFVSGDSRPRPGSRGISAQNQRGASGAQTFNGPMADANDVYRPVALPSKPGAQPSMTDAQRDELEHQIHCQCGLQPGRLHLPHDDFACSVSPAMHADVMVWLQADTAGLKSSLRFRRCTAKKF